MGSIFAWSLKTIPMQTIANPFQEISERLFRVESTMDKLERFLSASPIQSKRETHIDIEKAAAVAKKSIPTMYRLARLGKIPCRKQGNRLYFLESEILAWIESGRKITNEDIKLAAAESLKQR